MNLKELAMFSLGVEQYKKMEAEIIAAYIDKQAKEWPCPDTGRTCTAEDCDRSCFKTERKPDAYITETEQGEMVWTKEMYGEACMYCDDGEFPEPLFRWRKS